MNKHTIAALSACALASTAMAGERMVSSGKETYTPAPPACFGDREWQIDLFGAYAFTDSTQERIMGDHAWGGGLGVNYFFQRNFGIGLEGMLFDPRGGNDVVGTAALNVIFRFPIDSACFAPYIYGGIGAVFNAEDIEADDFTDDASEEDAYLAGHAGFGVEYRFTRNFGVFVDARYTWVDESKNDFVTARSGFRIAF
jgi:opacity protein-like surface antigen